LSKKTSFIFPLAVGLLAAGSPQQVYAQYDDSLSGAIASIACSKGGGQNMTMLIYMLMNPMGYMGQGQSSNFYTTGLKLTNWLETNPTKKQKAQFIAEVFDKSTQKCPNNFGQNEYNNIRKEVSCYKKVGSSEC
jgi:hypothetical protein